MRQYPQDSSRTYDTEGAVRPTVDTGFRIGMHSGTFARIKTSGESDWRENMAELTDYRNHGGDRWESD